MRKMNDRARMIARWREQYPGIHVVFRQLADGSERRHIYPWRGRGASELVGEPGTVEFSAAYAKATASKYGEQATIDRLFDAYLDSAEFANTLRPRTQSDYRKLIAKAREKWGTTPIKLLEDKRVRGLFRKWRDKLAKDSLRQADYMMSVMSAVFSLAIRDGEITTNPVSLIKKLYDGTRVDLIWTQDRIDRLMAASEAGFPQMRRPLLIALWTGLHQGDIRELNWSDYDGQFLRVDQNKGQSHGKKRKILEVPVAPVLKAELDAHRCDLGPICPTLEGRHYTEGGFRSVWQDLAKAAGVHRQRTFNDFRGTAVTRLHSVGVPKKDIGLFTGHSDAEVNRILERHYLHRDRRAEGLAAVDALDRTFGAGAGKVAGKGEGRGGGAKVLPMPAGKGAKRAGEVVALRPRKKKLTPRTGEVAQRKTAT